MNSSTLITLLALLAVTGAGSPIDARNDVGNRIRSSCSTEGSDGSELASTSMRALPRRGMRERGSACAAACNEPIHSTKASNANNSYESWCNKTNHETLCVSMVQSDPRENLKSDPQGLVVILVSAARAKANVTSSFIKEALRNETEDGGYDEAKEALEGCLAAYSLDWVGSALSVDVGQVKDVQRCSGIDDALRDAVGEVTYDCEWDLPSPRPPLLSRVYKNVEAFASIVDSARQILGLIGCGGL